MKSEKRKEKRNVKRESHKKVLAIPLVAFVLLAIIPPLTTSGNGTTECARAFQCGSGHSGSYKWIWAFTPQIEINQTGPFILDEPNTVYNLAVDLKVPENGFHYFTIAADGVTLDLRGHTITGAPGYFGVICDGRKGITVALGTIEGFDIGIVVCDSDVNIVNVEITGMFKILRTAKSGLFSTLVRTLIGEYSQ